MLNKKFWILVKKDGFLKTWTRGHMASRHSHYVGGLEEIIKPAGIDDFGNKYYEDFQVGHRNQRRWVEYSDYFLTLGVGGDRVPPKWQGWLSHQYDDVPCDINNNFVNHEYIKPHTENQSYHPLHYKSYGSIANPDRMQFIEETQQRRATKWNAPKGIRIQLGITQTKGKKILVQKNKLYDEEIQ